jgi:hypothetical protein
MLIAEVGQQKDERRQINTKVAKEAKNLEQEGAELTEHDNIPSPT